MIQTINNFTYGEIGDVLDGNKTNQIYSNSAVSLTNCIVGEAGTLRAVEGFTGTQVIADTEETVSVLTTKYGFYVVITRDKIYTVDGSTVIVEQTLKNPIVNPAEVSATIFANTYCGIVEDGVSQFYEFNDQGADLINVDYLKDIVPPVKNRKKGRIDVHRVYEIEEVRTQGDGTYTIHRRKTIERLQSLEDPMIEVKTNKMIIEGLAGTVARIYGEPLSQFRLVTAENSDGEVTEANVEVGDIIVNFPNGIPSELVFNNVVPSIEVPVDENGLTYYTEFHAPDGEGRLVRGTIITLDTTLESIAEYQNRLVFATDDTMYFSGINEYQNFQNYTEDNDPFWVKIPPINNRPTKVGALYSSRILYILTDRGIYTMGATVVLTPRTSNLELATDTGSSKIVAMVDGNLFFIGTDGRVYSIQEMRDVSGTKLYSYVLEKYNFNTTPTFLTTVRYEKRNRLLVMTGTNMVHIYDIIGNNEYRRTTVEATEVVTKAWGMYDKIFAGYKLYSNSGTPKTMKATLHPPYTMGKDGSLMNDSKVKIDFINLMTLGDVSVKIDGQTIPNKTTDNTYTTKTRLYASDKLEVEISSGSHCELLAIEYSYEPAGRL